MTDQTFHDRAFPSREHAPATVGFFGRRAGGVLRTVLEDFRAVPGEAWAVLAVAAVASNLFIALT